MCMCLRLHLSVCLCLCACVHVFTLCSIVLGNKYTDALGINTIVKMQHRQVDWF